MRDGQPGEVFRGPHVGRLLGAEGKGLVQKPQQHQHWVVSFDRSILSRALRDICSRRLSPQAEDFLHGKAMGFCAVSGAVMRSVAVMAGLPHRPAEQTSRQKLPEVSELSFQPLSSLVFHLQISKYNTS